MTNVAFQELRVNALFVAIELSKSSWVVALTGIGQAKPSQHRIDAHDSAAALLALLQLIDKHRTAQAQRCGGTVDVFSCYEAGRDGFWLHRALAAQAITSHVLDAASLLVDRRAKHAKTDKLDATRLLHALIARLRGDRLAGKPIHVPTPEQEDDRRLGRERDALRVEKTRHTNRIAGLLASLGMRDFQPLRPDWQARLAALRGPTGHALPPNLAADIARQCQRLHLLCDQLAEVLNAIKQRLKAQTQNGAPVQLTRLRGIDALGADTLGHEVFFRDFANRRQLGAYLGFAATPHQSGATARDTGITKAGNPRARRIAIELAWLWIRHQPQSELTRWFHKRVADAKGRVKRIFIVALARRLVIALWRFLTTGLVPQGAALKA